MAGLPRAVIERAREILSNLEAKELSPNRLPVIAKRKSGRAVDEKQTSLFNLQIEGKIEKQIKSLDVNNITPVEALVKLNELKKLVGD